MSQKTYYSEDEISNFNHTADMIASDLENLNPETIESTEEAKARVENIIMGMYNLAADMGVEF